MLGFLWSKYCILEDEIKASNTPIANVMLVVISSGLLFPTWLIPSLNVLTFSTHHRHRTGCLSAYTVTKNSRIQYSLFMPPPNSTLQYLAQFPTKFLPSTLFQTPSKITLNVPLFLRFGFHLLASTCVYGIHYRSSNKWGFHYFRTLWL